MKRVTMQIVTSDGIEEQKVLQTGTPGLVIAKTMGDFYTVTHALSGKAIPGHYCRLDSAQYLADMLDGLANWLLPESELIPVMKIPGISQCVDDAMEHDYAVSKKRKR